MNEKEVLKKIWRQETALKENLVDGRIAEDLWNELLAVLDTLPSDSIHFLRYKKLRKGKMWAWYRDRAGYPESSTWQNKFEPFLKIFEQYEAEKTLKQRLEMEDFFIESRIQGQGDQHILIGEKNGDGNKVHLVIDEKTAEIRIEDRGHQQPEELLNKIETILTLKNGKKIRTTREMIESLDE